MTPQDLYYDSNVFLTGNYVFDLDELLSIYQNLNFRDQSLLDFTSRWKESGGDGLINNLEINANSPEPFLIEKIDGTIESYYDLSRFLLISDFESQMIFVNLSKQNYGQLIYYPELATGPATVFAPNLRYHLENVILGLEKNKYEYREKLDFFKIPVSWDEREKLTFPQTVLS